MAEVSYGIETLRNLEKVYKEDISKCEEYISKVENAILVMNSKKSQIIAAEGDYTAACKLSHSAGNILRENYNGSDTAEEMSTKMTDLHSSIKNTWYDVYHYWNIVSERLTSLKRIFQTELEYTKTLLSHIEADIAKYNKRLIC